MCAKSSEEVGEKGTIRWHIDLTRLTWRTRNSVVSRSSAGGVMARVDENLRGRRWCSADWKHVACAHSLVGLARDMLCLLATLALEGRLHKEMCLTAHLG